MTCSGARRRLGHHPVLYPPALSLPLILACVIVAGTRLVPAPGHRASASGGLHDYLRGTPGRRERLKPKIVVVVAPATAVAGAATTTPFGLAIGDAIR